MFPIADDADRFPAWRIANLAERERRAIMHLQPYNTKRDDWQWVRYHLSYLDALHNIDKHRKLHVVIGVQHASVIPHFPPESGFRQHLRWGPVESHSHVDTWTFDTAPAELQSHTGALLQIALEHGPQELELLPTLHGFVNSTAEILRFFSNRFPPVVPAEDSEYGRRFWATRRSRSRRGPRGGTP